MAVRKDSHFFCASKVILEILQFACSRIRKFANRINRNHLYINKLKELKLKKQLIYLTTF